MRLVVCLALLAAACSKKPETPEERVRAFVQQAETAASEGDVGALRDLISEQFRGQDALDKRGVVGLLNFHFLRAGRVHSLTRIAELRVPEPTRAEVGVVAALAATPISSVTALPTLHADLFRFDLRLAEEDGEWRLLGVKWRRADGQELLSP